jgi:hypothetical protein
MRLVSASALSFAGAWQRTRAWGGRIDNRWLRAGYWLLVAPVLVTAWWLFVAAWYVAVFPVLFVVTIPYRLVRRGSRRNRQLTRMLEGGETDAGRVQVVRLRADRVGGVAALEEAGEVPDVRRPP